MFAQNHQSPSGKPTRTSECRAYNLCCFQLWILGSIIGPYYSCCSLIKTRGPVNWKLWLLQPICTNYSIAGHQLLFRYVRTEHGTYIESATVWSRLREISILDTKKLRCGHWLRNEGLFSWKSQWHSHKRQHVTKDSKKWSHTYYYYINSKKWHTSS